MKADQVIERASGVILPQLHHGIGHFARARIHEAHRLERAKGQRLPPARSQDLHGQATFEHQRFFKAVRIVGLRGDKGVIKAVVFRLRHGAVEVIRAAAIARSAKNLAHIDGFQGDDGRGRVEKVQFMHAGQRLNGAHQGFVRQRAGGEDGGRFRDGVHHLASGDFNQRFAFQDLRHAEGKRFPIHRQRAARGHACPLGAIENQRIQQGHLRLEQARGVGEMLGLERIGADQFRKAVQRMGGRMLLRLHIHQAHGNAAARELPGRLTPGQPRAHHCDPIHLRARLRERAFCSFRSRTGDRRRPWRCA